MIWLNFHAVSIQRRVFINCPRNSTIGDVKGQKNVISTLKHDMFQGIPAGKLLIKDVKYLML